jgi:hypothetical protein
VEFERGTGDASRSSFIGGGIYLSDYAAGVGDTPHGSKAGMKLSAWWTRVDTNIIGSNTFGNETGIWVPTAIEGGYFYIRATGFQQSGDVIVKFDSKDIKQTTWVIECAFGDTAVSIPADWDDSNSITIIREDGSKTLLTPGKQY